MISNPNHERLFLEIVDVNRKSIVEPISLEGVALFEGNSLVATCLQSDEALCEFAEQAPFPIWISDPVLVRTYFNSAWLAYTGKSLDQEIGPGWMDGIHPNDLQSLKDDIKRVSEDTSHRSLSYRLQDSLGRFHCFHEIVIPRFDSDGVHIGFWGAGADRLTFEKSLLQFQSHRGAIEGLASVLSHEIKAPLRAIEGFAEALSEDFGQTLDPEALGYLNEISQGALRMRDLLGGLTDYCNLGKEEWILNPINSEHVIMKAIGRFKDRIEETQATLTLVGEFPVVLGNRRVFSIIFESLIDNSLKFVSTGEIPEVTIEVKEQASCILFMISDNGIGIDPAYHEEVFGIFRKLHVASEFPGCGMGLSLARKAAEIHCGRLAISPQSDMGTRFELRLPRPQTG